MKNKILAQLGILPIKKILELLQLWDDYQSGSITMIWTTLGCLPDTQFEWKHGTNIINGRIYHIARASNYGKVDVHELVRIDATTKLS